MPVLLGLHVLVALACAIHAVRTGQPMYWLFILFIFPALGSAVYVLAVILPGAAGSATAHKARAAAQKAIDPGREARAALTQVEISRTPGSLKRAADALLETGRGEDALTLAREAASGAFAEDEGILFTLARAQFATGQYDAALATLDTLRDAHPDLRHPEGHLLYARTLEALGRTGEALTTYAAVADYYPGPEARARWAMLLEQEGDAETARARWQEIMAAARHAPKFVLRTHRKWLDMARSRA
ncbi:tetratricopeptide repeat protein [Maricaulis virginensis]|nr:tetratricopeptide repeat protein [Maricaulis virginensis]